MHQYFSSWHVTRDTWHVTCLSVVSRWCHPWREWENIHQPPPTVSCHSVCPRLRVTENIQQSSDVNMEHATLHGWLLGSVKGWIIVNYRSAKLNDQSIKKPGLYLRKNGFSRFQCLSMDRKKQGQMPIGCGMHMHATANEKALVLVSEWVSPSACHWHRLKPGTLPSPKSVYNYIFTLLTLLAVNGFRLGDNLWETECCADPRRWLIE